MYLVTSSLACILHSPFFSFLKSSLLIFFPVVSDLFVQWIIKIWSRHQSLDGKQDSSNLESRRPLVLEDIETDSSKFVNVWMVNLCSEKHLWWNHWVLIWKEEFTVKKTSLIRSISWSCDLNEEMSEVLFIWFCVDSDDYK